VTSEKRERKMGIFNEIKIVGECCSLEIVIPEDLLEKFIRQYGIALRFTNYDSEIVPFASVDKYWQENAESMHVKLTVPKKHEKKLRGFIKKFGKQNGLKCNDISAKYYKIT
jgi:hypothetical protein